MKELTKRKAAKKKKSRVSGPGAGHQRTPPSPGQEPETNTHLEKT
jgi:hypothetical protein